MRSPKSQPALLGHVQGRQRGGINGVREHCICAGESFRAPAMADSGGSASTVKAPGEDSFTKNTQVSLLLNAQRDVVCDALTCCDQLAKCVAILNRGWMVWTKLHCEV